VTRLDLTINFSVKLSRVISFLSYIISFLGGYSITHNELAVSKNSLLQHYKIADNECVMSCRITPCLLIIQFLTRYHNFKQSLLTWPAVSRMSSKAASPSITACCWYASSKHIKHYQHIRIVPQ
jgi:hypothetical protein